MRTAMEPPGHLTGVIVEQSLDRSDSKAHGLRTNQKGLQP
jgi:hypothetical protein